MGGRKRILVAAGLAAALALPHAAVGAPRHGTQVADPTGTVAAEGWAELGDGQVRHGSRVTVTPPSPGGDGDGPPTPPGAGPFVDALTRMLPDTDPDGYAVPGLEAPDMDDGPHLPDLGVLPAWAVYADETVVGSTAGDYALATLAGEDPFGGSRKAIRFGVTITNVGRHSLEVIGVPRPSDEGEDHVHVDAFQCVRFAGPRVAGGARVCQAYEPVGALVFHAQHGHFHIDGFAQYRLLRERDGRPDPGAVVSRSEKVGFCMGDTDWLGEGALLVDTGWYRECRHTTPNVPVTVRQGISPSWGDSYGPGLDGQHLVIEGVPDGIYWIEVTVNPPEYRHLVNLRETDHSNNTSYRRIRIFEGGTRAEAL